MERTLKKIAVVADKFAVGGPAQQILDRFLIGYPRDGAFHRLQGCEISAWLSAGADTKELERRVKDFGLRRETELNRALANADGVIVVPRTIADAGLVQSALPHAPPDTRIFVHGALAGQFQQARQLADLAASRRLTLAAATSTSVTWRLPDVDVPQDAELRQAMIVVQGAFPAAELDALDALLTLVARRKGGETGVRQIRRLDGHNLWLAGEQGDWSWPLLAAAISRSDSPQGDPVRDGRTQNLVGLGLLPRLVAYPRGWLLEHHDGLRTAILVLDGAVADYNFAIQSRDGGVISAQLFRPLAPQQHHFSSLAAAIEDFFRTGTPRWPATSNLLIPGLLEVFSQMMNASQDRRDINLAASPAASH